MSCQFTRESDAVWVGDTEQPAEEQSPSRPHRRAAKLKQAGLWRRQRCILLFLEGSFSQFVFE